MARAFIALLLTLALVGLPLALAVPCADAPASCCCEKPAGDCTVGAAADCGCVVENGSPAAPVPAASGSESSRAPVFSPALPVNATRHVAWSAPRAGASKGAARFNALRLHVVHGVFLC